MEMTLQKVARLLSHTHTFRTILLVSVMMAGSLGVKAQIFTGNIGIANFSAPTSGPAIAPVRWTGYGFQSQNGNPDNTIKEFRVVVTVSNGACINKDATVASLNALFPSSAFTVTNTVVRIDYPANSAFITLPSAGASGLLLFNVHFANTPGTSSTIQVETTPTTRPYFVAVTGQSTLPQFPLVGNPVTVPFNSSALIKGFIEKPGVPASNCTGGTNNSITNVTLSFKVPPGQCVPIVNLTTGTNGLYSKSVLKGFDYEVRPSKINGNQCGVTSYDHALLGQHILLLSSLTSVQQYIAGDVDLSNSLNANDLSGISHIIAGDFDIQPGSGYESWRFVPTQNYAFQPFPPSNWLSIPNFTKIQNIQSNVSNNDFVGIKMGDINQSCSSCNQMNLIAPAEERSEAFAVQLFVPGQPLSRGENVVLPVTVDHFNHIFSFSTFLGYDPALLQVEKITPGSLPIEYGAMVHDPETNAIRYAWCSEDARQGRTLRDGESILLVYAKVLQDIPSPEQAFRLTEEEDRINELYDVNLSRGIFTGDIKAADPNTGNRDLSLRVFPNPFHNAPTLSFYLPEAGICNISISNAAGKTISSTSEYREAGQYYWQPENLPTHPGVLFCRLSMGVATRTLKLVQN
ncbi:MAG TPA: hypothetical protein PLO67_15965 [Saprospiraceae bacterium]|nr:hypothetical protein [Saprospiraceae bacterium]